MFTYQVVNAPVIRFWKNSLLMTQQPTMTVSGVDDVDVTPFKWTGRRVEGWFGC